MTNATTKITPAAAEALEVVRGSGKTPWVILNDNTFDYVYSSRTEARADKAIDQIQGVVTNANTLTIEVVTPVAALPVDLGKPFDEITEKEHAEHRGEDSRPRVSTTELPCQRVFIIADSMIGARRRDVIAACVTAGVAYYTARTQYQYWLTARKEMLAREAAKTTVK